MTAPHASIRRREASHFYLRYQGNRFWCEDTNVWEEEGRNKVLASDHD